jgi:hypothetical protein
VIPNFNEQRKGVLNRAAAPTQTFAVSLSESDMSPSIDAYRGRARQIHEILFRIASHDSLRIGFPSRRLVDEAYAELLRYHFKKPFFASKKQWTRRAIIFEPQAYEFLWPHVELEFIVDGAVLFFSGVGKPRRNNPGLAPLEARLPEIYWSIDLDNRFDEFSEVFEHGSE